MSETEATRRIMKKNMLPKPSSSSDTPLSLFREPAPMSPPPSSRSGKHLRGGSASRQKTGEANTLTRFPPAAARVTPPTGRTEHSAPHPEAIFPCPALPPRILSLPLHSNPSDMKYLNETFWKELLSYLLFCLGGFAMAAAVSMALLPFVRQGSETLYLHLIQWGQTVFLMILPPLLWTRFHLKTPVAKELRLKRPGVLVMLSVTGLIIAGIPLLECLAWIGQHLPLPQPLESWAQQQQSASEATISALLAPEGPGGWAALILLVCLATAVGEELMFRGALLNIFLRTGTPRWLTALTVGFVFAFIHFDIYGLLPRWALGTLFVYLVYWSGSIWPGIWAHTLNNLMALVQYKLFPDTQEEWLPGAGWIIGSAAVCGLLLYFLRQRSGQ